jgi:shikimate kinase
MNVICLIGFRGAGKTTLGQRLSSSLNATFLDLDERIEKVISEPILSFFQRQGEPAFREIETQVLREIVKEISDSKSQGSLLVLALGGGTLDAETNRDILGAQKKVGWKYVWLNINFELALERMRQQSDLNGEKRIPLAASDSELRLIWAKRYRLYEALASSTIDINKEKDPLNQLSAWIENHRSSVSDR